MTEKIIDLNIKNITREDILSRVNEAEIYQFYFEKFSLNQKHISPFRNETNPSFYFFKGNSGNIVWRDWGDSEQKTPGDVFEFIKKLFNCDFRQALEKIDTDMELHISSSPHIKLERKALDAIFTNSTVKKKLNFTERKLHGVDYNFWEATYMIKLYQLSDYGIIPITDLFINDGEKDRFIMSFSRSNPMYAFKVDGGHKIYCPYHEIKWLYDGDGSYIFGLNKLPEKGNSLIITKSLKDIIVLNNAGFHAIAPQSEAMFINNELFKDLSNRFNGIYLLYDNDDTGLKAAEKIKSQHPSIKVLQVPKLSDCKDISDYQKFYTSSMSVKNAVNMLINSAMKRYE